PWRECLHAQAASIVACDFFTVESLFLRRYYALFFIAHSSRRVWLAGCTANPTGAWVTQQARNLGLDFSDQGVRFLRRDRDSKYSGSFDEVFRSEGIRIVKTPVRAPNATSRSLPRWPRRDSARAIELHTSLSAAGRAQRPRPVRSSASRTSITPTSRAVASATTVAEGVLASGRSHSPGSRLCPWTQ